MLQTLLEGFSFPSLYLSQESTYFLLGALAILLLYAAFLTLRIRKYRKEVREARKLAKDSARAAALSEGLDVDHVMRFITRGIVPDLDAVEKAMKEES